jgi:hypothetical protein
MTADVQTAVAISGRNETSEAFRAVEASFGRLRDSASAITAAFAGLAGAGVVFSAFKGIIDQADSFNKLAQRTGIATEALSELNYAAKLSDVSQEALSTSLKKLAVNMADAAGGGKEAAASFKAIGVEIRDSSGNLRGTDAVLQDIAARFATFADGPEKAALAVRLFGRSGESLIPLLNSMSQLREEGRQFGAVYGTDFARAAEQFNDNMTRLGVAVERVKVEIVGGMLPGLTRLSNEMLEGARIAGGLTRAFLTFSTINPFADTAENIRDITKAIQDNERELARSGLFGPNALRRRILEVDTDTKRKQVEFLKFQQREAALTAAAELGDVRDARDRSLTDRPLGRAPVIADATGAAANKVSEFQRALAGLRGELARTSDEGNKYTEVFNRIASGEFGRLTEEQRRQLLQVAAQIETEKQLGAAKKETEEAVKRITAAEEQRNEAALRLREEFGDLADPGARFERQQRALGELQKGPNALDAETADVAYFKLQQAAAQARGEIGQVNAQIDESKQLARDFGLVMSSAISDSIREWKGFGDLIKNVGIDIAQVITKIAILRPIEKGLEGIFSGGGSSSVGGIFEQLLSFAFGGKKAGGGPVFGGTAYLVGEQGPELFVPGQSGSIVPNGALAGGGMNVTVNISAPGVYDSRGLAAQIAGPLQGVVAAVIDRRYTAAGRLSGMARG